MMCHVVGAVESIFVPFPGFPNTEMMLKNTNEQKKGEC